MVLFGMQPFVGARNHVLDEGPYPPQKEEILGDMREPNEEFKDCAVLGVNVAYLQMTAYIGHQWVLCISTVASTRSRRVHSLPHGVVMWPLPNYCGHLFIKKSIITSV